MSATPARSAPLPNGDEHDLLSVLLESAGDFVAVVGASGELFYINEAGRQCLGMAEAKPGEHPLLGEFMPSWARRVLLETGLPAGLAGRSTTFECALTDARGDERPFSLLCFACPWQGGRAVALVGRDIAAQKAAEEQRAHLATHDPLTGLANRTLLCDRLAQSLARAARQNSASALLLVGLDRFKQVNESLGHSAGDSLLRLAAKRLSGCVRGDDAVARMGGDEFALLLSHLARPEDAARVAGKVLAALAQPCFVDGQELLLTASIGISCFPKDAQDAELLLRQAEVALYRAKEGGGNAFCCFSPDMNRRAQHLLALENDLRRALERKELELFYQPKADLRTGEISGAEALIRWRHPLRGLILPGEFIPLAEESGIILPVGEWALREACRQVRAWQEAGLPPLVVAVNLSARQFRQDGLVEQVARALNDAGLDGRHIELELTESMVMKDTDAAETVLRRLKALGVSLAMDDFGTGYSSLGYLKRFPFDCLKIDRSFVQNITTDPDDAQIAIAVIAMAHSLRLSVVAEGVEDEGQMRYLRAQRCDLMQGYFFARPMPAGEFAAFVAEAKCLPLPDDTAEAAARTLLLVDDELPILSSLRRLLRRGGYRILTAGSAEEGLRLLALNDVQVVVSDQRMPGMSGSEFLGRVKELYPHTVRLVLSGQTDLASLQSAINRGAIFRFLSKPWSDEEVRRQIQDAFQHYDNYESAYATRRPESA